MWEEIVSEAKQKFPQILKKVEETNLFPFVLEGNYYTQINEHTYKKDNDHLIKVFQQDGKWQYQNLKNVEDCGSLVHFIANRWNGRLEITKDPTTIYSAASIAESYYQQCLKVLRMEHKTKPKLLASTSSLKRRR